ncbi:hypothetical protein FCV25MIE_15425 [Fagus crenata]
MLLLAPDQSHNQGLQHGKKEGDAGEVDRLLEGGVSGVVKGQSTYAVVVGRGLTAKSEKAKEQMVAQPLSATVTKQCDDNLKIPQFSPPLPAKPKIRELLRFFPNENPISEKRKLGSGLKISINELGVRRVSREYKEAGMAREKWVPRDVGQIKLIKKAQETGAFPQPIFEVGESSNKSSYGPGVKPAQIQSHKPISQPDSQPDSTGLTCETEEL